MRKQDINSLNNFAMSYTFNFAEQSPVGGSKYVEFKIDGGSVHIGAGPMYIITDLDNNITAWRDWMKEYKAQFESAGYKFPKP